MPFLLWWNKVSSKVENIDICNSFDIAISPSTDKRQKFKNDQKNFFKTWEFDETRGNVEPTNPVKTQYSISLIHDIKSEKKNIVPLMHDIETWILRPKTSFFDFL